MSYIYYPGCSLKGLGRAYEESLLAVFETLKVPIKELPDWNCCGATAYMAIDEMKAFGLSARNLALAEKAASPDEPVNLVAPCSGCYLVLTKAQRYMEEYDALAGRIRSALESVRIEYEGRVKVRHPLDVLVNDIGLDVIASGVKQPLAGLKVACYYGCQMVRPYSTFDDQDEPTSMENLMKALGAEVIRWPLKTRCCGGSLTGTVQDVGLRLNYILLKEARKRGADVMATACPLCQFNLECYQPKIGRRFEDKVELPIAYFTQIIGRALGIDDKSLGMHRVFVPMKPMDTVMSKGGARYA